MKVKLTNNIKTQSLINYFTNLIEEMIPDRINDINIFISLESCDKNAFEDLDIMLHIYMEGYVNEKAVSKNIHRHYNLSSYYFLKKMMDVMLRASINQLISIIIKFSKTGELSLSDEIGVKEELF